MDQHATRKFVQSFDGGNAFHLCPILAFMSVPRLEEVFVLTEGARQAAQGGGRASAEGVER